jgi:hypothetical protein
VFAEAYRVLSPGGQILVSDIVTRDLPGEYRDDIGAWVGCIAGAVEEKEYIRLVEEAGFTDVKIVDQIVYNKQTLAVLADDACGCCSSDKPGSLDDAAIEKYADRVVSVKLSAKKPA